jgi:hypothetical protein
LDAVIFWPSTEDDGKTPVSKSMQMLDDSYETLWLAASSDKRALGALHAPDIRAFFVVLGCRLRHDLPIVIAAK